VLVRVDPGARRDGQELHMDGGGTGRFCRNRRRIVEALLSLHSHSRWSAPLHRAVGRSETNHKAAGSFSQRGRSHGRPAHNSPQPQNAIRGRSIARGAQAPEQPRRRRLRRALHEKVVENTAATSCSRQGSM
jgi:hypothetical protein